MGGLTPIGAIGLGSSFLEYTNYISTQAIPGSEALRDEIVIQAEPLGAALAQDSLLLRLTKSKRAHSNQVERLTVLPFHSGHKWES